MNATRPMVSPYVRQEAYQRTSLRAADCPQEGDDDASYDGGDRAAELGLDGGQDSGLRPSYDRLRLLAKIEAIRASLSAPPWNPSVLLPEPAVPAPPRHNYWLAGLVTAGAYVAWLCLLDNF